MAEMATKFQMWPKGAITSQQIYSENDMVDRFLLQAVWKDNIVSDSSIPANTELSDSTTHWWKRFPSPNLIPPCPANPVATTTTHANTLAENDIPTVKVQPLGHRCQASGVKRPSPQDPHNAGNKDQGLVKETKGRDNTVKGGSVRETKR